MSEVMDDLDFEERQAARKRILEKKRIPPRRVAALEAENAALRSLCERQREGLRPLASHSSTRFGSESTDRDMASIRVRVGDVHRAAALLAEPLPEQGEERAERAERGRDEACEERFRLAAALAETDTRAEMAERREYNLIGLLDYMTGEIGKALGLSKETPAETVDSVRLLMEGAERWKSQLAEANAGLRAAGEALAVLLEDPGLIGWSPVVWVGEPGGAKSTTGFIAKAQAEDALTRVQRALEAEPGEGRDG